MDTYCINIKGIVQGVGFRPFIWRLFNNLGLKGFVTNTTEGVYIEVNIASEIEIKALCKTIMLKKPLPSFIEEINFLHIKNKNFKDFTISGSLESDEKFQLISPDIATCNACIEDINNIADKRRYLYPFTNCTNCGPRFTIIKKMPYDRKNTTMQKFHMCPECGAEYIDPEDRRFHAQPNACSQCGPGLFLVGKGRKLYDKDKALNTASDLISNGKIIGIKSLGGFQIACSAVDNIAVNNLRKRKKRPLKPLAVMFKDIRMIKDYLEVTVQQEKSLKSSAAPIVLLKKLKRPEGSSSPVKPFLAEAVSFYNKYEGVMLPYTPLHHLLFLKIDFPLVMTSGNISEEPISSVNSEALKNLENICDYFLINNRDIYSKYDDSVLKIIAGREMLMRRARGFAPYPVKLDINIGKRVIFAAGANEKNTFCFLTGNYAILSQHIGDLDNQDSVKFYQDTFNNYRKLFSFEKIDLVVSDMHPDYSSTRFTEKYFKNSRKIAFQHHKAHIASVVAENKLFTTKNQPAKRKGGKTALQEAILGFSWDGTGFGDDGKIWGSEIFIMYKSNDNKNGAGICFNRIGHLREKFLPGGDAAIKKPYRMALSYIYELFKSDKMSRYEDFSQYIYSNFPFYSNIISPLEAGIIKNQVESGFNSPATTSMGRFFDAVGSVLNLTHITSFEGEAAIHLEMTADEKTKDSYDIKLKKINTNKKSCSGRAAESEFNYLPEVAPETISGKPEKSTLDPADDSLEKADKKRLQIFKNSFSDLCFEIDDFDIFRQVVEDINNNIEKAVISAKFHNTLVDLILIVCRMAREKTGISSIALTGGVFQNNILTEKTLKILKKEKFNTYMNFKVPVNDGGISLGQAYLAAQYLLKNLVI